MTNKLVKTSKNMREPITLLLCKQPVTSEGP